MGQTALLSSRSARYNAFMLGAIAGDIIGSVYEAAPIKTKSFDLFSPASRFTDDTVLTAATAAAVLSDGDYAAHYRRFARRWPDAGYGGSFIRWAFSDMAGPYGSWGNGSAMRVSPIGWAFNTENEVLDQARLSAAVTHDHPDGIRGAQAAALAVFLARTGRGKFDIRAAIADRFGYALDTPLDELRRDYSFDISCAGTVPPAVTAFLEAMDFEDSVRNAVSLGGDSDTLACITGAIAQAYFQSVPKTIRQAVLSRLPQKFIDIFTEFENRYMAL